MGAQGLFKSVRMPSETASRLAAVGTHLGIAARLGGQWWHYSVLGPAKGLQTDDLFFGRTRMDWAGFSRSRLSRTGNAEQGSHAVLSECPSFLQGDQRGPRSRPRSALSLREEQMEGLGSVAP